MKFFAPTRLPFALAALLLPAACSRELPSTWPDESPASAAAEQVPPASVTLALDGEPPLPSEDVEGWIGLEPPSAGPGHDPHGQHSGHAAPSSKPADGHGDAH